MASAPPRPGPAPHRRAEGPAVDLGSRARGLAFDAPSGNQAGVYPNPISASTTTASATFRVLARGDLDASAQAAAAFLPSGGTGDMNAPAYPSWAAH
jgi:hypothetical protein